MTHASQGNPQQKSQIIPVSEKLAQQAWITKKDYKTLYQQSIDQPDIFWKKQTELLNWITVPKKIQDTSFDDKVHIRWFEDGKLNVCYNCVDRHQHDKGNKTAIIWESDDGKESKKITYSQLYTEVVSCAAKLQALDIKKGDRVVIYMPMIVEAVYAMLACARIGAIHSVVFAGFSPQALKSRIEDCGAKIVMTADEGRRGGKVIPLKKNVDEAIKRGAEIQKVVVVKHTGAKITHTEKDIWYHEIEEASRPAAPEPMNAEDPLFILYTSGSTGKPKGVLHSSGGYLLYALLTHKWVFDYHPEDIYWCTADIGWITGHSYIVYGPLANGATTLLYEGVPNYPDWSRWWKVIDKHHVTLFYTAPTAIRAAIAAGDHFVDSTSRDTLRIIGTVGEPINPDSWHWYYTMIGKSKCPVIDTWWQTETGGHMITPLPGVTDLKPGSATLPFFGIQPILVDDAGKVLEGEAEGNLCIIQSWPGQMRTVYGDHARFTETYFGPFPGKYFTGDRARRDKDGYYWITGRADDVINVSGHRLGTAEIESALVLHEKVAEAAVVGYPHPVKGQGIYGFIILKDGLAGSEVIRKALILQVREEIGAVAKPDFIQFTRALPKTRSGKIMRRILRKIAANEYDELGDTNTLVNPEDVEELIKNRLNR